MTGEHPIAESGTGSATRWLTGAAIALGAVAIVVAVADVLRVVVLVGDALVPLWAVSIVVALIAVALTVAAAVRNARRPGQRPRWRVAVTIAFVGLAVAAAGVASVTGRSGFGASYTVLPEASDSGCRVGVVETSFLLDGQADTYAFPGGLVALATPQASLEIDGGGKPFARGLGTLVWVTPESAQISAPGMTTADASVACA